MDPIHRSFDPAPAVLIVAAHPERASEAVTAAGGRVPRTLDWQHAREIGDTAGRLAAIVVDARHAETSAVVAGLAAIVDIAARTDTPLVGAIERIQLDTIAPLLMDAGATILCDPVPAEWIAAIALAMGAADHASLHENVHESNRLERLNAEVARIAEVLARLTRPDAGMVAGEPLPRAALVGDRVTPFAGAPMHDAGPVDAGEIRRTIRARRLRDEVFGVAGLFEDPGWDMLLDLFASRLEHRQVSVSSLCIAAAVAPTTALRWIAKLGDAGLIERKPDAFDRRRAFVSLSDSAMAAMTRYVGAAKRAGLPLP